MAVPLIRHKTDYALFDLDRKARERTRRQAIREAFTKAHEALEEAKRALLAAEVDPEAPTEVDSEVEEKKQPDKFWIEIRDVDTGAVIVSYQGNSATKGREIKKAVPMIDGLTTPDHWTVHYNKPTYPGELLIQDDEPTRVHPGHPFVYVKKTEAAVHGDYIVHVEVKSTGEDLYATFNFQCDKRTSVSQLMYWTSCQVGGAKVQLTMDGNVLNWGELRSLWQLGIEHNDIVHARLV